MEENARSRAFIERLLRHQAFTPFLEELSREESLQLKTPMTSMPSTSTSTATTPTRASFQSQQFGGAQNTHVGMTLIPETPFDFSSLNINTTNNNWGVSNGFSFSQPSVFVVHELPEGPANPLDTNAMSGKGYAAIFSAEEDSPIDEAKLEFPIVQRPMQSEQPMHIAPIDDEDPDDLYCMAPASSIPPPTASLADHEDLFSQSSKALAHFSLVLTDPALESRLADHLQRSIAAMEPALQRLDGLFL
jgi:hypothetical protein